MLFQFVAIAFAAGGADVSVIEHRLTGEACLSIIEGIEALAPANSEWRPMGDRVLACIPDNVDF